MIKSFCIFALIEIFVGFLIYIKLRSKKDFLFINKTGDIWDSIERNHDIAYAGFFIILINTVITFIYSLR